MNEVINNRRDFLKKLFTISIFATTAPKLLATLEPKIIRNDNRLMGEYNLKLSDFPDLNTLWKSVRIDIFSLSQNKNINVIVTKVPFDTYGVDYTAVRNFCPHQGGILLGVNAEHDYVCNLHGSVFDVTGKRKSGVASSNLTKYTVDFNQINGTLKIIVDFEVTSVEDDLPLFILKQNYPNPSQGKTQIEFGTDKASNLKLELYSSNGQYVQSLFESNNFSGISTITVNTENLAIGVYIYRMILNGTTVAEKNIIVSK